MSIAALFIVLKSRNNPKVHQLQISKMWYIQTMEYYSAIKKSEVLVLAITWMNFENITLTEKKPDISP